MGTRRWSWRSPPGMRRDSTRLVIPKECFPPEFFWLSTGLAGEILQKWTNYGFRAAIFGDFLSVHRSQQIPAGFYL